jgi:hypothetical protein
VRALLSETAREGKFVQRFAGWDGCWA